MGLTRLKERRVRMKVFVMRSHTALVCYPSCFLEFVYIFLFRLSVAVPFMYCFTTQACLYCRIGISRGGLDGHLFPKFYSIVCVRVCE
jgi:hypothetical protein